MLFIVIYKKDEATRRRGSGRPSDTCIVKVLTPSTYWYRCRADSALEPFFLDLGASGNPQFELGFSVFANSNEGAGGTEGGEDAGDRKNDVPESMNCAANPPLLGVAQIAVYNDCSCIRDDIPSPSQGEVYVHNRASPE
jgi:hypothetical protein